MESITKVRTSPIPIDCVTALCPIRIMYKQNGIEKYWDIAKRDNTIQIILYNTSKNCAVVTKSFLPGIYMT